MVLINGGSNPFMSSFFQHWQRKAGLVTLVVACALSSGWLRSRSHCDSIQVPVTTHSRLTFGSANHVAGFSYETFDDPQENTFEWWSNPDPGSIDEALSMDGIAPSMTEDSSAESGSNGLSWRIRFASFLFGQSEYLPDFKSQIGFAAVPYWSLTIPLTLLSAYLLLVPSRKQPPPNPSPSHA